VVNTHWDFWTDCKGGTNKTEKDLHVKRASATEHVLGTKRSSARERKLAP
jgi:hypothetical protein